jgi:hypothetical protein
MSVTFLRLDTFEVDAASHANVVRREESAAIYPQIGGMINGVRHGVALSVSFSC